MTVRLVKGYRELLSCTVCINHSYIPPLIESESKLEVLVLGDIEDDQLLILVLL